MSDDIIKRTRELPAKATPGPWELDGRIVKAGHTRVAVVAEWHDARLTAAAPTLLAELCDELESEREAEDDRVKLLRYMLTETRELLEENTRKRLEANNEIARLKQALTSREESLERLGKALAEEKEQVAERLRRKTAALSRAHERLQDSNRENRECVASLEAAHARIGEQRKELARLNAAIAQRSQSFFQAAQEAFDSMRSSVEKEQTVEAAVELAMRAVESTPAWSSERPTEPGWYWVADGVPWREQPRAVQVRELPATQRQPAVLFVDELSGYGAPLSGAAWDKAKWLPLEKPEPPKGES